MTDRYILDIRAWDWSSDETMVFEDGDGSEMDGYTRRYATETEAIAGHREVVAMLEEELKE